MKEEIHSLEENHSLEEKHSTDLVEVIAKALVDNPEEVVVTDKTEGRNTLSVRRRAWMLKSYRGNAWYRKCRFPAGAAT